MRVFELTTMGRISLAGPEGAPVATLLAQPKRLGVLVYLAVAGANGVVRRDVLCDMFWPDASVDRARASLRQALAFVRRALGEDAIITRGDEEVGVDANVVRCDAVALRTRIHAHAHSPQRTPMPVRESEDARVVAQYTGEFMPGFTIDDAPRFDRWLEDVRSGLTRDVGEVAISLARHALARGDPDAVESARRACEIVPLDERAVVVLMETLDAAGDRAGALREYEALVRLLASTFDAEPAPETTAVAQQIRARSVPTHGGTRVASVSAAARGAATDDASATDTKAAPPTPTPVARPTWRAVMAFSLVAALAIVAAVTLWRLRTSVLERPSAQHAGSALPGPAASERVLVAPFVNETGDAALDALGRMATDWITEGASRVEGLAVVPGTTLLAMDRARRAGDDAVPQELDAMARETGATMVVSGSYYRTGGTLHLQARLTDASLSTLLRPVETVSVPVDSVESGVARMRERVLASIAPLLDSTTHFRFASTPPSYEAYSDFLRGFEQFVDGDLTKALALFERAANADTTYRMAQLAAAIAQSNLGDVRGAFARVHSLKQARDRLGPVEQGTLDMLDGMLRGDTPAVYTAVLRTSRITPGSIVEYMVAESARRLNRPHEALRVLRALHPDHGELRGWRAYWREMGYALHMTGDYAGVLAMVRDAKRRYPASDDVLAAEVRAMAALGYADSVQGLLASVDMAPGVLRERVGAMYRLAGEEIAMRGDSASARRFAGHAVAWYETAANRGRVAGYVRALRLAGDTERARRIVASLGDTISAGTSSLVDLGILNALDVHVLMRDAGILAAQRGDTAAATRWERRIAQRQATLDESLRGSAWGGLQLDRAAIAAQRGELDRAITLLREALQGGLAYWPGLLADMDLVPLHAHPAWRAMMQPAG